MTKQITTIIVITALVFFGLGFAFANYYKPDSGSDTYQAGWDAAKQRLEESGFAPMMGDMEITSISGIVKVIKDNNIYLKIQPLTLLADSDLDNRIIETDENTKIYQFKEKDQAQYQAEMEGFNQKMEEQMGNFEATAEPIMPPEMFIKTEISFNDIKVGQQITVTAQENIKDIKEFKAIEIIVQFMPMMPGQVDAPPVE
ncbi:hypothetical protein KKF19_00960 [Patescibacteria group bacterium]|nr:hypothetical protein [Patescibacteria group bacterium]